MSDAIGSDLAAALVAAIAAMPAIDKGRTAKITSPKGNYSYTYAGLPDLLAVVRPVLAAHGLAIVQAASVDDGMVSIATTIVHRSGQTMALAPLSVPIAGTIQQVGGQITYLRRYALGGALGIAPDDDVDGNDVDERPAKIARKPPPEARLTPTILRDSGLVPLMEAAIGRPVSSWTPADRDYVRALCERIATHAKAPIASWPPGDGAKIAALVKIAGNVIAKEKRERDGGTSTPHTEG